MKVYMVFAKDAYVDITGTQCDTEFFGPWLRSKDAEIACEKLRGLTQRNYVGDGRMPRYEDVDMVEREVFDYFEDWQLYDG